MLLTSQETNQKKNFKIFSRTVKKTIRIYASSMISTHNYLKDSKCYVGINGIINQSTF